LPATVLMYRTSFDRLITDVSCLGICVIFCAIHVCFFLNQNMQKTALETLHEKAPELLPQQGTVFRFHYLTYLTLSYVYV